MFPKPSRYRNEKYLDWIRSKPCFECGRIPSEPHHVSVDGSGWGTKPSDLYTLPLCYEHHRLEEDGPILNREEVYREIARQLEEWVREGEK